MIMMPKTSRQWDELPCPECGAENVVIVDTLQQIEGRCKECGKDVVFVRDGWNTRFLDRIKKDRKFDPGKPF
jgi:hypothetical protein